MLIFQVYWHMMLNSCIHCISHHLSSHESPFDVLYINNLSSVCTNDNDKKHFRCESSALKHRFHHFEHIALWIKSEHIGISRSLQFIAAADQHKISKHWKKAWPQNRTIWGSIIASYELEIKSNRSRLNQIAAILAQDALLYRHQILRMLRPGMCPK